MGRWLLYSKCSYLRSGGGGLQYGPPRLYLSCPSWLSGLDLVQKNCSPATLDGLSQNQLDDPLGHPETRTDLRHLLDP
jgi:hypothetical protein